MVSISGLCFLVSLVPLAAHEVRRHNRQSIVSADANIMRRDVQDELIEAEAAEAAEEAAEARVRRAWWQPTPQVIYPRPGPPWPNPGPQPVVQQGQPQVVQHAPPPMMHQGPQPMMQQGPQPMMQYGPQPVVQYGHQPVVQQAPQYPRAQASVATSPGSPGHPQSQMNGFETMVSKFFKIESMVARETGLPLNSSAAAEEEMEEGVKEEEEEEEEEEGRIDLLYASMIICVVLVIGLACYRVRQNRDDKQPLTAT